jgi:hypothetical protein
MNGTDLINDNYIVSAGEALPRIAEATPLDGRKVHVHFTDGSAKTVDLAPALASRRIYIPLRDDDALFRSFRISEYRNALEWNDDLDFSAMWLKALPPAEFANSEFRDALDRLQMTYDGMALALGISRRTVADYLKDKPIPIHIGLATRYLLEHHAP